MNRHRLDPFSLLFGALFLGAGVSFLVGSTIGDLTGATWSLFAIIAGSTFVAWSIATVVRERRDSDIQPDLASGPEKASATIEDG